jgi:outer membrane protein assembly factor BamB
MFTVAQGSLVALRQSTGEQLWERPLAPLGRSWADHATCLAVVGDRVVISLLGSTVGFDVNDGEPVWQISGEDAGGPWTVWDGTLYSPGKVFRAVDVASGTVIVEGPGASSSAPPPPAPTFRGTPVVTDTHVFIGDSLAGRVWAFDRHTLTPVWMYRPPGGGVGERMVIAGGRLYSQAGPLRCIG